MPKALALTTNGKRGSLWLDTSDRYPGYRIVDCPQCGEQGLMPPVDNRPTRVGLMVSKAGLPDDIHPLGVGVTAVSAKFISIVRSNKLTGVRFLKPVEIVPSRPRLAKFDEAKAAIERWGLRIMQVRGSAGSALKANGARVKSLCKRCGWIEYHWPRRGLRIDWSQWDGSDFFHVEEVASILITDRAAKALANAGLSNFGTQSLSQL